MKQSTGCWKSSPTSPKGAGGPTQELLDFQAEYYGHLYRMFISSAADGIFFWWYPGGYRVNERSDYGIINPDGSDRPVTETLRRMGPRFLAGPEKPAPDYWIGIDRDLHPAGIAGIYKLTGDRFWDAREAGKTPGFKTAATGADTRACPLLAVGNKPLRAHTPPYADAEPKNPPKYLDGWFDEVGLHVAGGGYRAIEEGAVPRVPPGEPVRLHIKATNLGEAAWLNTGRGAVFVFAEAGEYRKFGLPVTRVPRHASVVMEALPLLDAMPDAPVDVHLTFQARDEVQFGPLFSFTLAPETDTGAAPADD